MSTALAERAGEIQAFEGDIRSGVWTLRFKDGSSTFIDSGTGARAIAEAFGTLSKAKGQTIRYTEDRHGIMLGFEPEGAKCWTCGEELGEGATMPFYCRRHDPESGKE